MSRRRERERDVRERRPTEGELDDDEAFQLALRDHPEWGRLWQKGRLPDEMIGPNGEPFSPRMHLHTHAIVERQLAGGQPPGIADIARQLASLGVDPHEIRHRIGGVLARHLWRVMHEKQPFDAQQYLRDLQAVVAECRASAGGVDEQA